jgi:hypothetical protein
MLARDAIGLRAGNAIISGNLVEMLYREIGMSDNNRAIDEPDLYFWAAAGTLHQCCELD